MEYVASPAIFIIFCSVIAANNPFLCSPSASSCPQVSFTDLGGNDTLSSDGIISQTVGFPVQISRFNILCLSSSSLRDRYQSTSVLVGYICPQCRNGNSEEIVEQFTFNCGSNNAWNGSTVVQRTDPSVVDFDAPVETSCVLCEDPDLIDPQLIISNNYSISTHCVSELSRLP